MVWYHYVAYLLGALFFTNAVPHFVAGVMGHGFQSPFAKPAGEGFSSSTVNALWGSLNVLFGYLLIFHVGDFAIRNFGHFAVVFTGMVLGSLVGARGFGRFNGGNDPLIAQAAQRKNLGK